MVLSEEDWSSWDKLVDVKGERSSQYIVAITELQKLYREIPNDIATGAESISKTIKTTDDVVEVKIGRVKHILITEETQKIQVVFDIESKSKEQANLTENMKISELAIVLDSSGSMKGEPLTRSKEAICQVIDKLGEANKIHIINYSTDAQLSYSGYINEENQLDVKMMVMDNINAQGSTNIMSGIMCAIKSFFSGEYTGRANRRIFLFSDGVVNYGVSKEEEILAIIKLIHIKFAVNFTSFGLGADFDEKLMKGIAEKGNGDFFFIDGAEDIHWKVNKGLDVFQSLYGINTKLTIFCSPFKPKSAPVDQQLSILVEEIHGFTKCKSASSQASLGDLCYDDLRQVLVTFSIQSSPYFKHFTISDDSVHLIDFLLSFDSFDEGNQLVASKLKGKIAFKLTLDEKKLQEIPHSLLVAQAISKASTFDEMVAKQIENGDLATLIGWKKESMEILKSVIDLDQTHVVRLLLEKGQALLRSLLDKQQATTRVVSIAAEALHHPPPPILPKQQNLQKEAGYYHYRSSIVHRKCF